MRSRTLHLLARCLFGAVMLLGMASQAGANLLVNGDFETGDFTGWTQFGDMSFSGVDSQAPQAGTFAAFFGPFDNGGISQTIATAPGASYHVDFWLQSEADVTGNSAPNYFEFDWDGVAHMTLTDALATAYTHYSFLLMATAASTTLTFIFQNAPAFWDFDTVSVTAAAIPEPGSLALLALACTLVAFVRKRRA